MRTGNSQPSIVNIDLRLTKKGHDLQEFGYVLEILWSPLGNVKVPGPFHLGVSIASRLVQAHRL